MTLRIGTFNAQNLFERAKALNLENESDTAAILRDISAFQDLLRKAHYDKAVIWVASQALKTLSITTWRQAASDHASLVAEFNL